MGKLKIVKFLPKTLGLEEKYLKYPPWDYFEDFNKEVAVFLLGLIIEVPAMDRIKEHDEYTTLSSKIMSKYATHYNKYWDYFEKTGVVDIDHSYLKENYCKGYKYHEPYTDLQPFLIIKPSIIKTASKLRADSIPSYLSKWYNEGLRIDINGAREYNRRINTNPDKYTYNDFRIQSIHQNYFPLKIDNTSFRFHTPLTNLKKELRHFLTYQDQNLVSLDIVNSQPIFSTLLFNPTTTMTNLLPSPYSLMLLELSQHNSKGVSVYLQQVKEGVLYNRFRGLLNVKLEGNWTREEAKDVYFKVIYGKGIITTKQEQAFVDMYPQVVSHLNKFKVKRYQDLAILLQTMESEVVIRTICKRMGKDHPKAPLFPIHDSIATTEEHFNTLKSVMKAELVRVLGFEPKLRKERWDEDLLGQKDNQPANR